MGFDTILGGEGPKTGNAEPAILYGPDGKTALKTTADSGAGSALAVQLWDSVLNDYAHISGDGKLYVQVFPGNAANNPLFIQGALQAATPLFQNALHAVNTITLPAAGPGLRNILVLLDYEISGQGTLPTQAAPVTLNVKDGATTIWQRLLINLNSAFLESNIPFPPAGIAGTTNTAMTISATDAGASNTSTLNVAYLIG